MSAIAKPPTESTPDAPSVVLHDVPWDLYEALLEAAGDQNVRMTYDRGELEIMSPLPVHEKWRKVIGRMIETMSLELDIEMEPLGSTTFRRKDRARGLEPDECYYVKNAAAVRNKDTLDLRVDPPPDLAVEVDITSRSVPREPIYAALGVPEIWRFDGKTLVALRLGSDGRYAAIERSLAFPGLRVVDLERFLRLVKRDGQTAVLRRFRDWVGASFAAPRPAPRKAAAKARRRDR